MSSLSSGFQQRASSCLRWVCRYKRDAVSALRLANLALTWSLPGQAETSPTPSPSQMRERAEPRVLQGGWYPWDPYQYRENVHGVVLASLPAVGGGVIRDLLFQRQPLGIVRDPRVLLMIIGTVIVGMLVIRISSFAGAKRFTESLRSRGHLGTGLIQICDGMGLASFMVIGVVVVLDTSVQPLWLWGPISAGITSSFGGMMRDLLRRDALAPKLQQELYPEIAVVWGVAFSLFLQWEAERLQPSEIFIGVVITMVGAFLTRMLAVLFRLKGWGYA
jgi:polar amino acid transport system substrate-binding protein